MKKYELTKERFKYLLEWFAADGKDGGEEYERIRFSLINFFSWKGFNNSEDLADSAINIVAGKLPQLAQNYEGDPAKYFHGVAQNLIKKQPAHLLIPLSPDLEAPEDDTDEINLKNIKTKCGRKCLRKLPDNQKELIVEYYKNGEKQNNAFRESLAEHFGVNFGALRVKIHRIRRDLKQCFSKCKENQST